MAKVSGYYQCSVETPMGAQEFLFTVKADGDGFHGQVAGGLGAMKVEGRVNGNDLAWTMAVPKPMPVTLTCNATIDGDALSGTMKAGIFGSFALSGTRTVAPAD